MNISKCLLNVKGHLLFVVYDLGFQYGVSDQFAPFDGIISFTVEEQPVGSFCIVGGRYHFRSRSLFPLFIPPQVCKIPTGSSDLTGKY